MHSPTMPPSFDRSSYTPLLSPEDLHRQLATWNTTEAGYPQQCLHELFEFQVQRTPNTIAVISEDEHISYERLNGEANQVAQFVRKALGMDTTVHATGAEPRVALFVRHTSPLVLVGFWGILKAGCAVVLMDTAAPKKRTAAILSEAQPQVILTQADLVATLPQQKAQVICLDAQWEAIAVESTDNIASSTTLESLAYLISTSGTTGLPKVVNIAHRGLSNLYIAQIGAFGIQPDDRVIQFSPMSFDASVWEIMMAHLVGATLCLGTLDALRPGNNLFEFMRNSHITVATLTPSVLALMPSEALPELRILISVGEACSAATVERWSARRDFYNAFGHAEGTICLTIGKCVADGKPPSVGRVVQNNRAYVINAQGQLANIGEEGELYIAGVGLAVGYTQEARTHERFTVPHIDGIPETRWYKTGDIVCWLPDGSLMYIRRVEGDYVKVHGVRIEPKEIETILMEDAAVLYCAVVDRPAALGNTELVAFVVLSDGHQTSTILPQLQNRLASKLPKSMMPRTIVSLDAMPVTPHGKLDLKALKARQLPTVMPLDQHYIAPRTALEHLLVKHFATVLNINDKALSIDAKITHFRNDSFSIAQLAAEIKKVSGVYVRELVIARNPTIRNIALEIEREQNRKERIA